MKMRNSFWSVFCSAFMPMYLLDSTSVSTSANNAQSSSNDLGLSISFGGSTGDIGGDSRATQSNAADHTTDNGATASVGVGFGIGGDATARSGDVAKKAAQGLQSYLTPKNIAIAAIAYVIAKKQNLI